jgi:DNA-binding transcriptional MocR family regulator
LALACAIPARWAPLAASAWGLSRRQERNQALSYGLLEGRRGALIRSKPSTRSYGTRPRAAATLPGYRIGWLATGRHMQAILHQKLGSTLTAPALTQAVMADLLACGGYDSHLRRIRRVFAENIDRMTRAVERSFPTGTRVSRPAGGFVRCRSRPTRACYSAKRSSAASVLRRATCFRRAGARHCLRLSCGCGWDRRIEEGLETIGALATAQLSSD